MGVRSWIARRLRGFVERHDSGATLPPGQSAGAKPAATRYVLQRTLPDGRSYVLYQGPSQANAELKWRQVVETNQRGRLEWSENGKLRDTYIGPS